MRMKIDTAKFGDFIAKRREKIYGKQSQLLLAEKLHIAGPTLTNIENGKRMPSFGLFIDLADALQMSPGELMMVMAERAPENKNYMEMNDWLFEKVSQVLKEYQILSNPELKELADLEAARLRRFQDQVKEGDILSDITPGVNPPNTSIESQENIPTNHIENS